MTLKKLYHENLMFYQPKRLRVSTLLIIVFLYCLIFKGSCLKAFASPTIIVFFVYELDTWLRHLNSDFTLKDCIFKGVKLPKNIDPGKLYTSYSIGFGLRSEFSLLDIN